MTKIERIELTIAELKAADASAKQTLTFADYEPLHAVVVEKLEELESNLAILITLKKQKRGQ